MYVKNKQTPYNNCDTKTFTADVYLCRVMAAELLDCY